MKKKIGISAVLLLTMLLTACGGGSDVANNNPTDPTAPTDKSGKLIIDNGRGTTNNQDTERVK
jgi:major membrane immunogen (membrane-anchored lipoprotein)